MKLLRALFLLFLAAPLLAQTYDVVLSNGRAIDPETGLDAVRNVGINHGRIAKISAEPLQGLRTVDAKGLVIAPGFIDLHQHANDLEAQRLKAMDGVTTALEMEIGVPDVAAFLNDMRGHSLINYGTSASHPAARALAFGQALPLERPHADPDTVVLVPKSGTATNDPATDQQIAAMEARLRSELRAGGLAIGMGIQYTPGATRHEVIDMFRLAAENRVPVYTHVRSIGRLEPGSSVEAISEVIGAAAITGASLHIVHINSSCAKDSLECLAMVEGARGRGLDVTTEAYPYIAGMTYINSALFNPGFREKFGIEYSDLVLPETGEKLTKERFEELHASSKPQVVLIFLNTQAMVDKTIPNPLVMIASDGEKSHPRNAGTYCRVLRMYVREQGTISLTDAIRKMSLMPAQMLERSTPAARLKGRLQEGADADLVVFDPATVTDRSTYANPKAPSEGMKYVMVSGHFVVDGGKPVENVYPGAPLVGTAQ